MNSMAESFAKRQLKKGDRVTVRITDRAPFNGTITGEGREGCWWWVLKDGNKLATSFHKDFCWQEAPRSDDPGQAARESLPRAVLLKRGMENKLYCLENSRFEFGANLEDVKPL